MIAFIGSVFSPWYAWARGRGGGDPLDHVSINAILYRGGCKLWAMTERGRARCDRGPDHLAIGPSSLRWEGDRLVIDIDEWTVPLPRRLSGRITVHPDALFDRVHALDAPANHRWRPVAPTARVEVAFDRPAVGWKGSAYVDMNAGDAPLERDLRFWTWSRGARANRTTIFYDVEPREGGHRALALDYGRDGSVVETDAPMLRTLPKTLWRVARAVRSERDPGPREVETLEDTPFYTRSKCRALLDGETVPTICESVDLDRFASPLVRTLLPFRMPRRPA